MQTKYLSILNAAGSLALGMGSALADGVKSDQPVKDSYITTKVKAELAKDKGTSAMHIHVTTKDGVSCWMEWWPQPPRRSWPKRTRRG